MKRIILALVLAFSSLVVIVPASANTLCADGTISYSVGSGTCSWHGGIAGGSSRSKSYGYSDPYGSSSRSKSYGYSDPYGSSLGGSYGSSSRSKSYGYSDPYGSSLGGSYGSSLNNKSRGNGSSSLSCSYLDRSRGRC
jgi:hypothetical protein